jgi:hypothetical protein
LPDTLSPSIISATLRRYAAPFHFSLHNIFFITFHFRYHYRFSFFAERRHFQTDTAAAADAMPDDVIFSRHAADISRLLLSFQSLTFSKLSPLSVRQLILIEFSYADAIIFSHDYCFSLPPFSLTFSFCFRFFHFTLQGH